MTSAVQAQSDDAVSGPVGAPDSKGRRLRSLDMLRGLTVLGMIVVNATAGIESVDGPVFPALLHAEWVGFTIADTVFPAFIFMVGVSIAIAMREGRPGLTGHIAGRALRLILLGLLLGNMYFLADFSATSRLPGVLQRIGIVYAIVALLFAYVGQRTRLITAVALLVGYWLLCLLPSPDGVATDLWRQGQNFVSWSDRAMLGGWRYVQGPFGYDPEGLLSTLPAIAEALIGTLVGDYLRKGLPVGTAAKRLALVAIALIAGGLLWGLTFPIAKNLWTSSFTLLSAGIALLFLAGFHGWVDRPEARARSHDVLSVFGRNAIAAYVLHELAFLILTGDAMQLPYRLLLPLVGSQIAALAPVALFVAIIWAAMAMLDRRGWYFKI